MRSYREFTSMLFLIMAFSSLMVMVLLVNVDRIVNGVLYGYGLRFSGEWAMPYWTSSLIMFGICWFNIISAIVFQLSISVSERKESRITSRQSQVVNEIPLRQTQVEQSVESASSEKFSSEEPKLSEGLEQKTSSRGEDTVVPISVSARAEDAFGLTGAEELIYDGVDLYFHPDTEGRSFKTDFPDREFKQGELARLYREKSISKDEYALGLIRAFPLRLEEDLSNKILDYLEGWLESMNNAEEALAVVKECRQDRDKWDVLWIKMCRQYEAELQQEALAA